MPLRGAKPAGIVLLLLAIALAVGGALLATHGPRVRRELLTEVARKLPISDRLNGSGNSEATIRPSDTGIAFGYRIRPGFPYPWAGINLRWADSTQAPIDFADWEGLAVRVRAVPYTQVRLQILADDLARPDTTDDRTARRFIYHVVDLAPDGTDKLLPWSTFIVPWWWQSQTGRHVNQRLDLLDRVREIEFHCSAAPQGADTGRIEILSVALVGPSPAARRAGRAMAAAGLAMLSVLAIRAARGRRRREMSSAIPGSSEGDAEPAGVDRIAEGRQSVVLDDPRERQKAEVVASLQARFAEPELSLEVLAQGLGLSPRLASTLLREATGLHFKGALNELRLREAARLLVESRQGVSEIAYAVGFRDPSHFGRAFKERFGTTPSDHRAAPPPADSSKNP